MIEIDINERPISLGHNGTNFLFFTKPQYNHIKIHKIIEPEFKLENIFNDSVQWFTASDFEAEIPNEQGQVFSTQSLQYFVDKENTVKDMNYGKNKPAFSYLFSGCKSFKSKNYIFLNPISVLAVNNFFDMFYSTTFPNLTSNCIIIIKDHKIKDRFTFDRGIVSIITNPDESILGILTINKLYFLDL